MKGILKWVLAAGMSTAMILSGNGVGMNVLPGEGGTSLLSYAADEDTELIVEEAVVQTISEDTDAGISGNESDFLDLDDRGEELPGTGNQETGNETVSDGSWEELPGTGNQETGNETVSDSSWEELPETENQETAGEARAFLEELEIVEDTGLYVREAESTASLLDQKVEQIVTECTESGAKTELEIALWLHDWLIEHAEYDQTYTEFYADGVLLKGKGVCQSYSYAYQLLLKQMDIESEVVSAPEMDHAWNIVKINGSWTHIDCTWDDPVPGNLENHDYFGLSDAAMAETHQWSKDGYPACSTIVWDDLSSELSSPYSLNTSVEGIDFTLTDTSGKMLTRQDFRTGNTLLIFGNPFYGGTMGFVNAIAPLKTQLSEKGLNVIVVFENKEQLDKAAGQVPFTCTYTMDGGYEETAYRFRTNTLFTDNSLLVVLQNPQGYSYFYSDGFVREPGRVLATALQELPVTEETDSVPLYFYKNEAELEEAVVSALENHVQRLKLRNPDNEEFSGEDQEKVLELIKKYSSKYQVEAGSFSSSMSTFAVSLEYRNDDAEHEHDWGEWKNISEATIKDPIKQERVCSICGEVQRRDYGGPLPATAVLSTKSISLKVKQSTKSFSVSGMAEGDYVKSWKSSNPEIVKVSGKQDGTCKLTAQEKTGKAKITIKLYSGLKKTLNVTVQKGTVKTKTIKGIPGNVTLKKGGTLTLRPVISPADSQDKVTFKSSNGKVASVNAKGVIRAKKAGTAKITVKSGKKKVVCKVKVKK